MTSGTTLPPSATEAQWAAFFSGPYACFVDGRLLTYSMQFSFFPAGGLNLRVTMKARDYNDHGDAKADLKTGFIRGTIVDPRGYQHHFYLGCVELMPVAGGGAAPGFDPAGKAYIRWEGKAKAVAGAADTALQFNSIAQKQRPAVNYPWNLPPYGPG